jgi:hypothetical protein
MHPLTCGKETACPTHYWSVSKLTRDERSSRCSTDFRPGSSKGSREAVRAATGAYLVVEDAAAAWVEDRCERDRSAWEPASALYASTAKN